MFIDRNTYFRGFFLLPQIELNDKHFKVCFLRNFAFDRWSRSDLLIFPATVFIERFALLSVLYVHLQSYVTIDVEFWLLYDLTCLSKRFSSALTGNFVRPRDLTKLGQLLHPPGQSKRFQISLNRLRDIAALSNAIELLKLLAKSARMLTQFWVEINDISETRRHAKPRFEQTTRTIRSTNPRQLNAYHASRIPPRKFLEAFNLSSIQITFRFPRMWFMIFLPFLPVVLHK